MLRFILLILVQVYVLDRIHLHYMVTPYIYFLFILWMPFEGNRAFQMLIAFALGFTLDGLLISQQGAENNYQEPSAKSMGGFIPYLVYAGMLTLVHHGWLFFLEAMQFGDFWYFIVKTVFSTAISLLLIMIVELLFSRKQAFRTNTV